MSQKNNQENYKDYKTDRPLPPKNTGKSSTSSVKRPTKRRTRFKRTRLYHGLRGIKWFLQDKRIEYLTRKESMVPISDLHRLDGTKEKKNHLLSVKKQVNWVEFWKNVSIVFLSCSAIYLATQVEAFTKVSSYLQDNPQENQRTYGDLTDFVGGLLPISMMVIVEEDGEVTQTGLQYNKEQGEVFFETTSQLLKEALGNLGNAQRISEEDFYQAVLSPPSLYFELFGSVPLDLLEKWLYSNSIQGNDGTASRLALATWQGNLALLYQEEEQYFACPVSVLDESRLVAVISQVSGVPIGFVGQVEGMSGVDPLVLWGGQPDYTPIYTVTTPFEQEEEVERLLSLLYFPVSSQMQYNTDEDIVLRSGTDSVRLSYDGTVLYQGEQGGRYTLPRTSSKITLQEQVEGCHQLTNRLLSGLDTLPEVSLYSVKEDGDALQIAFSFALNGIPIVWNQQRIGAEFSVVGDVIESFTLQYRNYTATEVGIPTLPLEQVQAVLKGVAVTGGEVFLAYQDIGGEMVSAGWVLG